MAGVETNIGGLLKRVKELVSDFGHAERIEEEKGSDQMESLHAAKCALWAAEWALRGMDGKRRAVNDPQKH